LVNFWREKIKNSNLMQIIEQNFSKNDLITKEKLYNLFKKINPDLKKTTFSWQIYNLKQNNLLQTIKKGVYTLKVKPEYQYRISDKLNRLFLAVKRKFLYDNICIWNSFWLNEFMTHQPIKYVIILEIDDDIIDSVYYFLRDNIYKQIYLKPDNNIMQKYTMEEKNPLILLPFKSRSPIKKYKKVTVPKIEKILVDIYIEKELLYWIQGKEIINIFNAVSSNYKINFSTLIGYARRRGANNRLMQFLEKNIKIPEKIFK